MLAWKGSGEEPALTDANPNHEPQTDDASTSARIGEQDLARVLTGDLPCARCQYNLRGLSILHVCGECGLPVKATLLAVIDPRADELREIEHPTIMQVGLLAWAVGAFIASILLWLIRLPELFDRFNIAFQTPSWFKIFAVVCIALSGLGASVLIRPHAGISRRDAWRAVFGVACYAPLAVCVWVIADQIDAGRLTVYLNSNDADPARSALRLVCGLAIIGIALSLRPNALRIAVRSVLVRTGRVDRQPMTALAAAAGLAMFGDVLHLVSPYAPNAVGDLLHVGGVVAIAAGSVLLTMGLFGMMMDVWRLRPLIAAPGIGLVDIFEPDETDT